MDGSLADARGLLLYGPAKSGKTETARALAAQIGGTLLRRKAGDLRSKEAFDAVLQEASGRPAVLMIEGLDAPDHATESVDALLESIDTLAKRKVLVVIAARRPETLDPALMRDGRFSVRVPVGLPDLKERLALLEAGAHGTPFEADVDLAAVAKGTAGLSPEELTAVLDDARHRASRRGSPKVAAVDVREALDRLALHHERPVLLTGADRFIAAYHEAGHAVVSFSLPHAKPVRKITILPHGLNALGLLQASAAEGHKITSRAGLVERMALALAGRAAEELAAGHARPHTEDDLDSARALARNVLSRLGVPEKVETLVDEAAVLAKRTLSARRHELDAVAAALLDHETLDAAELESLLR